MPQSHGCYGMVRVIFVAASWVEQFQSSTLGSSLADVPLTSKKRVGKFSKDQQPTKKQ